MPDTTPTTETDEQRADREETEQAHAAGDHEHCGITCEAEFTSEKLRNGILWRAAPGSAAMLDELLRRAARLVLGTTAQPPAPPAEVCTEHGAACHTRDWPAPGAVAAAPVDRAAVPASIYEVIRRLAAHAVGFQDVLDESDRGPWGKTIGADIAELRRMAVEAQPATDQPDEAHPAERTWAAELHDPGADEWVPFGSSNVRATALHSLERGRKLAPVWADGTPTQRRLVRATTTYTVGSAADQPDTETEAAK